MNVIEEIKRINETELSKGLTNTAASWHSKYANSAWLYIGNIPNTLTEGDVICVFSQFGEVEDFNLVRDDTTGKSRGFAFLKYNDARSCILAVDNLSGSKILGRSLRVDHVENYRLPKHLQEKRKLEDEKGDEEDRERFNGPGHAYYGQDLASSFDINAGHDLFAPLQSAKQSTENLENNSYQQGERTADRKSRKDVARAEKIKEERRLRKKSHKHKHRPRDEEYQSRKKRKKSEIR
mmetsp:Transcript_6088/g.8889  ORF Transcript_6088/g.8889 Transcript_6088/m.8889 type:complete len:237 (-) Transcript_6088:415-1125(-)